ncbi:NAD(P)-dependent oxidoreductase [Rhodocytophaga aerolata]|uniref:NAD(P)-dependent oxidoreductase n=1 Tax=Rhodocytophaga aerolata TaxID=455078 RepID=A0ABT8R7V8_9BACT|nr:NAD(P)-dependent oxidoreductase [Rhodocytophaga aerolata]MDO1448190.1 NAD(P)-dependent oxidoreductase [Rhodocytophaga aerolata]
MNNLLVTGSSGQLGSTLVKQLRQAAYNVVGIDTVLAETTSHLVDIRDKNQILSITQSVDAIIHTAAMHGKQYELNYPREEFISTNIQGTLHLLDACVVHGIKKFVYTSTTSIYGYAMVHGQEAVWVDESLPPDPRDIYDITKLTAELLCRDYFEKEGIKTTVLRVSRFLPEPPRTTAIHRLYRGLDVRDGAAAHLLALKKTFNTFEVFTISAKSPFQRTDVSLLKTAPEQLLKNHYPEIYQVFVQRNWAFPASIDRVYAIEKAEKLLGYAPQYNFQEYIQMHRE